MRQFLVNSPKCAIAAFVAFIGLDLSGCATITDKATACPLNFAGQPLDKSLTKIPIAIESQEVDVVSKRIRDETCNLTIR